MINGVLWKLPTGAPSRDLPLRYGSWQTCSGRFARWRRDGTWDRLLAHAQAKSDAVGAVVWEVTVDSTAVRAHQHVAGARTKGAVRSRPTARPPRPWRRSGAAGGLTSKLHLACDGKRRPLAVVLTPGQRHDSTQWRRTQRYPVAAVAID